MKIEVSGNDYGEKPKFVVSAETVAEGEILRMFMRPHKEESVFCLHSYGRIAGRPETYSFCFGFRRPYEAPPLPEPTIYELAGIDCP